MVALWIISLLITFTSIILLIPCRDGDEPTHFGVRIVLMVFQTAVLATLIWMGAQIWFTN